MGLTLRTGIAGSRSVWGAILAAATAACLTLDSSCAAELPDSSFSSLSIAWSKPFDKPSREYTGLPFGSWMVYPSVLVGSVFDDNVYQTQTNKVARFGGRIAPNIIANTTDGIHAVSLYGNADARIYGESSDTNVVNARAGVTYSYEASRDLLVKAQGDFTRQSDILNSGSSVNTNVVALNPFGNTPVANPTPYNQYTGSVSVIKMLNTAFVAMGGSITHITYDQPNIAIPAVTQPAGNGTVYMVNSRVGYWIGPAVYAYAEPSLDWRRYDTGGPDSNGYRVVGGFGSDRLGLFRGEIYGGYQAEDYGSGLGTAGGSVYGGRVSYYPNRSWTISASLDESIGTSATAVSPAFGPVVPVVATATKVTTAMLQSNYAMSQEWTSTVRFGFTESSYVGVGRRDDSWLAGAMLTYSVWRNFGLTLDYQYSQVDSNVPFVAYTRNVVTLGGTYKY